MLRADSLARLLDAGERAALDRGDELRPVIRKALQRRVAGLAEDHGGSARHEVVELLLLLEQLGQAVPFEAQTVFFRIWRDGDPRDPGMAELAARMGFATDQQDPG